MSFNFQSKTLFPAISSRGSDAECESTFSSSLDVSRFVQMSDIQCERTMPIAQLDRDRDILFAKIVHAIKRGRMTLDFKPVDANVVTIPPKCVDDYTQCVLYWCARLDARFPEVLEASARAGQSSSVDVIKRTIKKIRFEDEACQTNAFFPAMV